MQSNLNKKLKGFDAEQKAYEFLLAAGLRLKCRNYHCRHGEIDLIMEDHAEMVFVEVRFRSSTHYGDALESVDQDKQKKLIKSAIYYLQTHQLQDKVHCRFDVIGFSGTCIDWIKDAFSYE